MEEKGRKRSGGAKMINEVFSVIGGKMDVEISNITNKKSHRMEEGIITVRGKGELLQCVRGSLCNYSFLIRDREKEGDINSFFLLRGLRDQCKSFLFCGHDMWPSWWPFITKRRLRKAFNYYIQDVGVKKETAEEWDARL